MGITMQLFCNLLNNFFLICAISMPQNRFRCKTDGLGRCICLPLPPKSELIRIAPMYGVLIICQTLFWLLCMYSIICFSQLCELGIISVFQRLRGEALRGIFSSTGRTWSVFIVLGKDWEREGWDCFLQGAAGLDSYLSLGCPYSQHPAVLHA